MLSWIKKEIAFRKLSTLVLTKQHEKALTLLDAFKPSASNIDAMIQKAWILADQKEHTKALLTIQSAREFCHDNALLDQIEGEIHFELKDHEKAKACFLKSLAIESDNLRTLYGLGLVLLAQNQFDEAARCFEELVQYDRRFVRSRLLAASEHYMLKQKNIANTKS